MERPLLYKDLFEIISDQEYLEENAACFYFKQLVSIVINCQKHGVIHRDIKPENVLVNLITNKVTLIDFGSGDFIQENFYTTYDGETDVCLQNLKSKIVPEYPVTSFVVFPFIF